MNNIKLGTGLKVHGLNSELLKCTRLQVCLISEFKHTQQNLQGKKVAVIQFEGYVDQRLPADSERNYPYLLGPVVLGY